jgi:minor extracellular serine protease Vpr
MSGGFQTRQSRRVLIGVAVLVALAVVGTTAAAGSDNGGRPVGFERLPAAFNYAGFVPAMAREAGDAKLIIKLNGAPVAKADAQARQQGKQLTKAEKEAIRQQLRSEQSGIEAAVRDLGGKVEFAYQDAYNGVAVTVPLSAVGQLASRSDVESVQPQRIVERDNVAGVQFIRGNEAWTDTGNTGDGVKIAVIDTGLDYTHANFGGSGDPADFDNNDGTVIEPGSFPTDKVVAGTDFVGDDYNASSSDTTKSTPHPDPDPLDCNGHGSHTAGTAAGFGVLDDGSTFAGPYDGTTYTANTFKVGPGVAPEASLMAYRVFGCEGSATDAVVVAAIDQAVEDGADVISMSLGSVFGRADAPDAVASDNASEAGVVVVASAGNNGPSAYLTGSPAAADRAISVAAIDASSPTFPGANLVLSTGTTVTTIDANGADLPAGTFGVAVLRTSYPSGPVSLGCDPADYGAYPGGVSGKVVVTKRGTCARVARAIFGQQAGAAAVVMINTDDTYPPFEGQITSNPDTGEPFTVTIPFLGAKSSSEAALVAADGGTTTIEATEIENTAYKRAASFTSGGPRNVDSAVKPEVMAPGVSVLSTLVGSGTEGTRISGTSMACPMTSGAAALIVQAHPDWTPEDIKAALINTAEAGTSKIASGYLVRTQGSGVIDARRAVDTVAIATTAGGKGTLDYGAEALAAAYSEGLPFTITNTSGSAITYDLANAANGGALGATMSFSSNPVIVPAGARVTVTATLSLDAPAVAALPAAAASNFGVLVTIRGAVTATPTASGTGLYVLRVPYLVAPRGLSSITATASPAYVRGQGATRTRSVSFTNTGIHGGEADIYAWGISDPNDVSHPEDSMDVRDVGVQALPRETLCGDDPVGVCGTADDQSLIFVINNWGRASNPGVSEFDIAVDTKGNAAPEYFVVGVDLGAVLAGDFDGRFASFIFDAAGNLIDAWVATAPMNGSTLELPALASELGLAPKGASTKFDYSVAAFSIVPGDPDIPGANFVDVTGVGHFRLDKPPVSTGDFIPLAPGETKAATLSVDVGQAAASPVLGWLSVSLDDATGEAQADEIPIGTP